MMSEQASSSEQRYKAVEYKEHIYRIPVRHIDHLDVVLLSDIQALVPNATALMSTDKLIPFLIDPVTHIEYQPKRIAVFELDHVWQVHVPDQQSLDTKLDRVMQHLDMLFSSTSASASQPLASSQDDEPATDSSHTLAIPQDTTSHDDRREARSPPPAFSSSPPSGAAPPSIQRDPGQSTANFTPTFTPSVSSTSVMAPRLHEGEAPPSYENSILGSLKTLTSKLRLYEQHIPNRHKSPRWLTSRAAWLEREPVSIGQVAFDLVQFETALLWTAVSQEWIQERETWITLVASARSERHLAGALIDLERHTLVMDEQWSQEREQWINELLEMVVLPLSHG